MFVCMCLVYVFGHMYVWPVYVSANVWNVAITKLGFLLSGRFGLQVDFGEDLSPMDIWSHIIDDEIIEHIRQETNERVALSFQNMQQQGPLEPWSNFATRRPTSPRPTSTTSWPSVSTLG